MVNTARHFVYPNFNDIRPVIFKYYLKTCMSYQSFFVLSEYRPTVGSYDLTVFIDKYEHRNPCKERNVLSQ